MTLYFQESGPLTAPTIVFLHGNGAHSGMWKAHLEALPETFHCLAPDFPGFGRSGGEAWVSLPDTADRVAELIRIRGGERAHVVGLSLGASVTLTLLSRHPQVVDHAIIDGAGILPLAELPVMKLGFPLMQPFLHQDWLIRTIATGMKIPPEEFAAFRAGMLMMSPRAFVRAFLEALSLREGDLPGLRTRPQPTLLVAGEKEPGAVHASNRQLAAQMPQAVARLAPNMGHGWLAEAPELHIRMVRAWLQDEPLPAELLPEPAA
jgi:pimeloyl-ACP methyl ester carboxylesterase